jgi:hypothetical protein
MLSRHRHIQNQNHPLLHTHSLSLPFLCVHAHFVAPDVVADVDGDDASGGGAT